MKSQAVSPVVQDVPIASSRRSRARFTILALIAIGTVVNYLDRTVLGIAAPTLTQDLGLSAAVMGSVFSAFSWTYTASQIPAGMFLDRVGVRKTYFLAVASWSTFIVLHGFVGGLASLLVCRFGLGVAESPCGAGGTARFSTGVYFRRGARRLRINRPRVAPSRCGLAGEWSPENQLAGRDRCRL